MTSRIAIVGAGKRVRQTVLPGVLALGDQVVVSGIHSRKPRTLSLPDGSEITTITSLDAAEFAAVDIVIVAVPTRSIRGVLEALRFLPRSKEISVVLDTPPLRLSDIIKTRTFAGFKSVIVAEDWFKLSPVLLIKHLVAQDMIGTLNQITLDRMSYRYHGLATVRALANAAWLRSIKASKSEAGKPVYTIVTGNGVSCQTIMPRDYAQGAISVTGTRGWISNHASEEASGDGYLIAFPQETSGWYQPMSLNGDLQSPDAVEQYMTCLPFAYLEDQTAINRLKIRGYARLIEDLMSDSVDYDIVDGLYDYVATTAVERLKYFRDVRGLSSNKSVLRSLLSLHRPKR